MKYTGRITATIVLFLIIFVWHASYFLIDKQSSVNYFFTEGFIIYDFIYPPLLAPIVWWLGKQYDRANYYSEKDTLTGAYNRRYVIGIFPKLSALMDRNNSKLSLSVIDVNSFKSINDTYGHDTGDKVLQHLSGLLTQKLRKGDIVARWGGDEFLIMAPLADQDGIDLINGRLMHEINEFLAKQYLSMSISVGTAVYPNDARNLQELIKMADQNMYKIKAEVDINK